MSATEAFIVAVNAEMDENFDKAKSGTISWDDFHRAQKAIHARIDRAGLRDAWLADFRATP